MTEYIITEDEYRAAMSKAYEAGKERREIYTARDYLTRPLVRCRDCKHSRYTPELCYSDERFHCTLQRQIVGTFEYVFYCDPDGYCAWGERKEEPCR